MQYEGNLVDINLYETKLKNSNLFKTTESSLEDSQIAQIKKQGYAGIKTPL